MRGAVQKLLSHWGAWFSIVVSSVLFSLLHQDIAQMPATFVASVLMGLAAYCTGSLAAGMVVHLANNTMSFCFLYATQKLDGVSAFGLTVYLTMIFCGAAAVSYTHLEPSVFGCHSSHRAVSVAGSAVLFLPAVLRLFWLFRHRDRHGAPVWV